MDEAEVRDALDRAARTLERGEGLGGTGFWKAVGEVRRTPALAEELGPRIAEIDRRAFLDWALLTVPNPLGTALASAAAIIGLGAVGASYYLPDPADWLVFAAGGVALFASTHGLGHQVAGRMAGMRFSHWFVGSVRRPQPGVKVDYATYLTAPARSRAWMHATGALVTKVLPFALLPAAVAADLPEWMAWVLGGLGVAQIVTDALWSVKASDWKKFRREMSYAP
ncbi:MAG: hypothetical protein ACLFWM_05390 [Actinomycetota bacterium]